MRGLNVGEFASLASDLQVTDYTLTWTAVRADRVPGRRTDHAHALCPAHGRVEQVSRSQHIWHGLYRQAGDSKVDAASADRMPCRRRA